eukprot:TRINITY_DN7581_c1_g1_i6.p3 TRINITY_DN7581_c1_g1~~TRINITY_DN7581_c1_g1_i6.p3  ORF type:complete len:189 (+),score=74.08 TRINITY_DN7581_c1_g1_i6:44-568(+)
MVPEADTLIDALAARVTTLARRNDASLPADRELTYYDSLTVPPVAIAGMLQRWAEYVPEAGTVLMAAAIFLERFGERQALGVHSHSMHRLVVAALVVASKYVQDYCIPGQFYTDLTGVSAEELARLQLQFWSDLDFDLHISAEDFARARAAFPERPRAPPAAAPASPCTVACPQ